MRSRSFLIATVLFFLSGALGLGYELVWIRKAALVVGASQIALSTVLTAFFIGLALGSYFVGRYLRTPRTSPLALYGLFELGIGAVALAFPWLFAGLEAVYSASYPVVEGSTFGLFAVRFLLLFAIVLVPTFFMGGTLPLLLDGLVAEDRSIGSRTSFLYGINILGAVVGVLATCYWAIPALGMNGTSIAGGVGNALIGVVALVLFRKERPLHEERAVSEPLGAFFPAAAFVSGLLAIAYQICWARYFTLFHTTTVYITALLLAVYLLALSTGSFVLARLLRAGWRPLPVLGFVQAAVPVAALACIRWWTVADYEVALQAQRGEFQGQTVTYTLPSLEIDAGYESYFLFVNEALDATLFAPLFQIALVIFVPVMLIGAGLPSLIAAAATSSAGLRSVSGRLVFWNTLGSSAGGFLGGYALIPLLGLHWTLFALGLGSLGLSVAVMLRFRSESIAPAAASAGARQERRRGAEPPRRSGPLFPFWLGFAAACLVGLVATSLLRGDLSEETIRRHGYGRNPAVGGTELVEVLEGPLTTSWVFDGPDSLQVGSGHVSLAVTYKNDISTQAIQGHIPVLFYSGTDTPKECLGICLGSGQSFGALLLHDIRSLDVVDISPEMVDLSLRYYEPYNHGLGSDPRVRFHVDDGRHFVDRAAAESYDVISMEPPPPTADGVYSLYSLEFYEGVRRILRPGGLFMQWLPLYRITPLDTLGIIKTQAEVFPETFVVKVGRDDFMVVSYPEPPVFDVAALERRCAVFRTERNIAEKKWAPECAHEIGSLRGVQSLLLVGPADIARLEAPMIYRDDTQRLAYSSGDRHLHRLYRGPALSNLSFAALRLTRFADLAPRFRPPLSEEECRELSRERGGSLRFFNTYKSPPFIFELLTSQEAQRAAGLRFVDGLDPEAVAETEALFRATTDPLQRAGLAMSLARAHDAWLDKESAYAWIAEALAAWPQDDLAEHVELAKKIVTNRIAVYADIAERHIRELESRWPASPLVRGMRAVHAAYREREARKDAGYLWPWP